MAVAAPTYPLSFSEDLSAILNASEHRFVVTGSSGWLGRATLEMLRRSLGEAFRRRVIAIGTKSGELQLSDGLRSPVEALSSWKGDPSNSLILFHYAFLTKDRVAHLSEPDYIAANRAISTTVRRWLSNGRIKGVIMPSSGAVYDVLYNKDRDGDANLYGRLKLEDEEVFAQACEATSAHLVIPRVFNLSGPFINKFDSYALASIIVNVLRDEPISLRAAYPVIRSYVYIGDLIELCLRDVMARASGITRFDTAGEVELEIGDLAKIVCIQLGSPNLPINRPPFASNRKDLYLGNRQQLMAVAQQCNVTMLPIDQQIFETASYIQSCLSVA